MCACECVFVCVWACVVCVCARVLHAAVSGFHVCVCVRACARARACMRACMCVCVCARAHESHSFQASVSAIPLRCIVAGSSDRVCGRLCVDGVWFFNSWLQSCFTVQQPFIVIQNVSSACLCEWKVMRDFKLMTAVIFYNSKVVYSYSKHAKCLRAWVKNCAKSVVMIRTCIQWDHDFVVCFYILFTWELPLSFPLMGRE